MDRLTDSQNQLPVKCVDMYIYSYRARTTRVGKCSLCASVCTRVDDVSIARDEYKHLLRVNESVYT